MVYINRPGRQRKSHEPCARPRRVRAPLLVVLLLLPGLAGCAQEEGPRRAQPTDKPLLLPGDEPVRPTGAQYDLRDPGYVVNGSWRVGDGWDYESNRSTFRRVRVVDEEVFGRVAMLRVEEKIGKIGGAVSTTRSVWVDPRSWSAVNVTDSATKTVDEYRPGAPLRLWRNTTLTYNHTRTDALERTTNDTIQLTSRLLPQHQTILFPWGYVEAKRVEQRALTRVGGNVTDSEITIHWVHMDFLNDVQYELDTGEQFKLVAAQVGNFRRGTLAS